MDTLARALLVAAAMVEDGALARRVEERYAGWSGALGTAILDGTETLESLEEKVAAGQIDPSPVSGHQELLENIVNQAIWSTGR
jgi:xylose isomerase